MPTMFQIDPAQLKDILSILANATAARPPWWRKLVDSAPLFVAVAAGVWTVYTYVTFSSKEQTLQLHQQELNIQQQEVLTKSEDARTRLELESKQLEKATQQLNLDAEGASSMESDFGLTGKPLEQPDRFLVNIWLKTKNVSKKPVEISWVRTQWFLGKEGPVEKNMAPINNLPNDMFSSGTLQVGPIRWSKQGEYTNAYPGKYEIVRKLKIEYNWPDIRSGGGGTIVLPPGDSGALSRAFLVNASRKDWVGVIITWGLNGEINGDSITHFWQTSQLSELEPGK